MRRSLRYCFAAVAVAMAACSDNQLSPDRVTPSAGPRFLFSPPPCPATVAEAQKTVDTLLPQLFGPGNGRRGKAQGYSNNIEQARRNGDTALELTYVDSIVNFTLQTYYAGHLIGGDSDATQNRVLSFIYTLYCASRISPIPDLSGIFLAENTVLIRNGTPTTIVSNGAATAAVEVEQGEVPTSVFGTFVSVVPTSGLPTRLDWYGLGGYKTDAFEFVANPPVTFDDPVLAGVCIVYDDSVVTDPNDLRLAHQVPDDYVVPVDLPGNFVLTSGTDSTIEIAAQVPASSLASLGLECPGPQASRSGFGRLLQQFARLVLPEELHAAAAAATTGGSTGGTVRKFSPFAAVDIKLNATGSGPSSPQYIPLGSDEISAPVSVTVKTRYNIAGVIPTPINGIPVGFVATSPAGSSFFPTSATTSTSGTASSTWKLREGTNTGTGTPARAPLTFSGSPVNFSVLAVQIEPVVVATNPPPPAGTVGVSYSHTFSATGGIGAPYTWSVVAGALPNGLALSTAGVLSGTPTSVGPFTFTVRATSGPVGLQVSGEAEFTIAIATPPVEITTTSLPLAQRGLAYSATLTAIGGDNVYSWSIISGTLPAGLALSGNTISGTPPATAVTSTFTVQATSDGKVDTQVLTLTVGSPTAITLSFEVGPAKNRCYAVNVAMTPGIRVKVRDQAGNLLSGVAVNMVAVTNNGSKVAVTPSSVESTNGFANFGGPTINKTGGYALIISTTTPWPTATTTSGKFNISPSC